MQGGVVDSRRVCPSLIHGIVPRVALAEIRRPSCPLTADRGGRRTGKPSGARVVLARGKSWGARSRARVAATFA